MTEILAAINNILNGSGLNDTVDGLVEKRTWRKGRPIRKKIKGRTVIQHKRIYRGQVNPRASLKAKRSAVRAKQKRKRGQERRWRTKRR